MLLLNLLSWQQLVCLAVASIGVLYLYHQLTTGRRRRAFIKQHGCQPAHQVKTVDPIFGLDMFFKFNKAAREHTMLEWTTKSFFGPGLRTTAVFNILTYQNIITCDAENIKSVLSLKFKDYKTMNETKEIKLMLGGGIFVNNGEAWHRSRELLRPIFSRTHVADLGMLERHVDTLIKKLPRDGSTVNLQKMFSEFTLSVAVDFLFGQDGQESSLTTGSAFSEAWDGLVKVLVAVPDGKFWILKNILNTIRLEPEFVRYCKAVHGFVDQFVEKALSSKPTPSTTSDSETSPSSKPYLFLPELASRTTDKVEIRAEALSLLFAGRDTTAGLLTNLFFVLSHHPTVWDRLQSEIQSTLADSEDGPLGTPTYEQLKSMKYLRAIINETQRLYPIVPMNLRVAAEDTFLPRGGGKDGTAPVFVRKDQMVLFGIYAMHRRRDIYGEDAEEFHPERWLDEEAGEDGMPGKKGIRMGWEFLPFSGGARVCIGQNFALTEICYLVVRLAQEFSRLESRDPEPWKELFTFICSNLGGGKVGLFPRDGGEKESEKSDGQGVEKV